jgi:hypothetical protein
MLLYSLIVLFLICNVFVTMPLLIHLMMLYNIIHAVTQFILVAPDTCNDELHVVVLSRCNLLAPDTYNVKL